jgi:hypothetical protein
VFVFEVPLAAIYSCMFPSSSLPTTKAAWHVLLDKLSLLVRDEHVV